MVAMVTWMLSLNVVLYLKKWISIQNGYLHNVGNCMEYLAMRLKVVSVFLMKCPPVFETLVVGFMSCPYCGFLPVVEIVSSCWRDAILVPISVPTIRHIVLPCIKCIHQRMSCNFYI